MTGRFAQALQARTASPPRRQVPGAPMARPIDPMAPPAYSPDVTAPRGADAAFDKVARLRSEASQLARSLRRLGAADPVQDPDLLRQGVQIEQKLAEVRTAADTAERALAESWLSAYEAARERLAPVAVEAAAAAVAAREAAEAARGVELEAQGEADALGERLRRLTVERAMHQRTLAGLNREDANG